MEEGWLNLERQRTLAAGLRRQVLPMFIVTGSQERSGPRLQEFLEGEVCQDKVQDMKPGETIAFS